MLSVNSLESILSQELDSVRADAGALGGGGGRRSEIVESGAAQAKLWLNIAAGLMIVIFLLMMALVIIFRGEGVFTLSAITVLSGVTLAGTIQRIIHIARTLQDFQMFEQLTRDLPAAERASLARSLVEARKMQTA
ncbi:hypothetical protein [Parasedimentitalea psychrophila]|uniref:Uncharacterized protein n=1 Tax=Parasedimentitalea psychrophila TaxID=2997337 RepID=A0A9Y2L0D9_9RHOB|nr:hypothetical protein [Parasedimentitalea psychrophila]WIY24529.1 hypothetical protein QPJ95_18600 [Parasedimentitalea psychrophila]